MRMSHFEALRPVCPVCRTDQVSAPLKLADALLEEAGMLVHGMLHCTNPACRSEYPVIDGIPLILANLRQFVSDNASIIYARDDLPAPVQSLLGDCCGPGALLDVMRQQLSSYAWDHYAEFDPDESGGSPLPGSAVRNLQHGVQLAGGLEQGPAIELGCSTGGTCLELAAQTDGLVLGVDLNYAMLRTAADMLRTGRVKYPRRRVGVVYDERAFAVPLKDPERVDFWLCDAAALPFSSETFQTAVGLNLLDCVGSPVDMLRETQRILKPEGKAILSCPYDWSNAATPVEAWVGGHSQRAEGGGASEPVLRALLTPGEHPVSLDGLEIMAEEDEVEWTVRMHARSSVTYKSHMLAVRKSDHWHPTDLKT